MRLNVAYIAVLICVFCTFCVTVSATLSNNSEKTALNSLYNQLDGDNWEDNASWDSGDPCDDAWFGVTCDSGGTTVVGLALASNGLSGAMPSQDVFGELSNLASLELSLNGITGSLEGILLNTQLTYVGVHTNALNEPLPEGIDSLVNLVTFLAYVNAMPGPIPDTIGGLSNMVVLGLSFNQFTSLPDVFDGMPVLSMAFLGGNLFTGPLPPTLGDTSLTLLGIEFNQFSGPLPDNFAKLAGTMNYIEATGNQLSGDFPDWFEDFTLMGTISLGGNQFTGNPLSMFCGLPAVSGIKIADNQFSGTLPECLGNLSSLSILSIANNDFSGPLPESFGDATAMSSFDVSGNSLTAVNGIPESYAQWTQLKVFYASGNPLGFALDGIPGVENSGGLEPLKSLPLLSVIDVSSCGITGDMSHLANNFIGTWDSIWTGVVEFNFHNNDLSGVIGGGILAFSQVLNKLDVSFNPQLTGSAADIANVNTIIAYGNPNLHWDAETLPYFIQVDEDRPFLSDGEEMQCPQFEGVISTSRVFIVDSSYHGNNLCRCNSGFYGTAPNCTSIPYNTEISMGDNALITDANFGTERRFVGIDTVWSISEPEATQLTITLTLGPDFVDFTDVLEFYEGDGTLTGSRALLLRGTDNPLSLGLTATNDENTYELYMFTSDTTVSFRSRNEAGFHFNITYEVADSCGTGFKYYQPTGRCEALYEVNADGGVFVMIIASLVLLCTLITLGIVIAKKHVTVIRTASVPFCILTLVFAMIQVGAVYFFVLQPSEDNDAACHARAWLFGIGTIGVLAPLIVKIRRIQKIFGSVEFNDIRAATKTAPLVKAIAIMMSIEVLFLIIYSAAGLGTADLYLVPDSSRQLNVGNGYVTYGCLSSTGSLIWVITQGVYIGGILCWLAYVGFVTRHVAEKYNESSHIAVSVYIILVLAMIVVPLQAVVTNNPEGAIILNGVGLCFLTTSTVVAIFFPKLLYVFSVNDAKAADRAATRIDRQQTGTPSGFQSRMGGKSRADTQSRTGTKSPVADDRGISSTDGLRSPTPSAATQVGSSVNMSKYSVTTPGRVIFEEELEGQQPSEPV